MSDCFHFEYTVKKISAAYDGKGFIVYTRLYPLGYPKFLRVKGGVKAENGKVDVILIPVSNKEPFMRSSILKWKLSTRTRGRLILLGENGLKLNEDHQGSKDWENGIRLTLPRLKDDQIINDDDSLVLVWSGQVTSSSHDVPGSVAYLSTVQSPKTSLTEYSSDVSRQRKKTDQVKVSEQQSVPGLEKPTCSRYEDMIQPELLQTEDDSSSDSKSSSDSGSDSAELGDGDLELVEISNQDIFAEVTSHILKSILSEGQTPLKNTNEECSLSPTASSTTLEQLLVSEARDEHSEERSSNRMNTVLKAMAKMFFQNFPVQQTHDIIECKLTGQKGKPGIGSALIAAAISGDVERVKKVLEDGTEENHFQTEDGKTALMTALQIAAFDNQAEIAKMLLEYHADTETREDPGLSPLFIATILNNIKIAKMLLENKANTETTFDFVPMLQMMPDITDVLKTNLQGFAVCLSSFLDPTVLNVLQNSPSWNDIDQITHEQLPKMLQNLRATPLVAASLFGHTDIVKLLLQHGADVKVRVTNEMTVLMCVCVTSPTETIEALLDSEAEVNACQDDGLSVLMLASQSGRAEIVELLLKHNADTTLQDNEGYTALMYASESGHLDIVKVLLNSKADANHSRKDGLTSLMLACHGGHTEIIKVLLENNADKDKKTNTGVTALMLASWGGHEEAVDVLLKHDADHEIQTNNGTTALMIACGRGYNKVVEMLIKRNADINKVNDAGCNALMFACKTGHCDVVKLLLENDADIDKRESENGYTSLLMAHKHGNKEVVAILLDFMMKQSKPVVTESSAAKEPVPKTKVDTEMERVVSQVPPEHRLSEELGIFESGFGQRQNIWSHLATFGVLAKAGPMLMKLFTILEGSLTDKRHLFVAAAHLGVPSLD